MMGMTPSNASPNLNPVHHIRQYYPLTSKSNSTVTTAVLITSAAVHFPLPPPRLSRVISSMRSIMTLNAIKTKLTTTPCATNSCSENLTPLQKKHMPKTSRMLETMLPMRLDWPTQNLFSRRN